MLSGEIAKEFSLPQIKSGLKDRIPESLRDCYLDEDREQPWSLWVVAAAGCAASMLTVYLLDFGAHVVGTIY